MMKRILLVFFLTAIGVSSFAQTKRIAYMSHSGRHLQFSVAEPDNLGNPPDLEFFTERQKRWDSIKQTDSVIKLQLKDSLKKDSLRKKQTKPGNKKTGIDNNYPQGGIIKDDNDNHPTASLVATSPTPQSGFKGWWLVAIPACVGFIVLIKRQAVVTKTV